MQDRPRIYLIDDHRVLTDALKGILGERFDVIGTFANGRDALNEIGRTRARRWPSAIVLDISMPDINGIELARHIKTLLPNIALVFLSMHLERPYVEAAFQAGGTAYVVKRDAAVSLVEALDSALAGIRYTSPSVPPYRTNPRETSSLPGRKSEVLELTSEGKSAREIASILGVSPRTVEYHKTELMRRLGLHNRVELTRYAIEHRGLKKKATIAASPHS
jgi:DNA-binding NarL/FixJ family response regulator